MQYEKDTDLPESVKNVLPGHAQDIYRKAFNNAWEEYRSPRKRRDDASQEEVSHRVAWQAVKKTYEKGDDDNWHLKSEVDNDSR